MSALPGDPTLVESGGDLLVTQANQIQKAADDLWNLTFHSDAKALSAVSEKSAETAASLETAETRYRGVGESLRTYAVELKAAHQRANEAAGSEAAQGRAAANHETSVRNLEQRARLLEANGAPAPNVYQAEQQLAEARYLLRSAEQGAAQAHAAVEQARRDMNAAAERAATRIKGVLSESNQGALDHIRNFFEGVGSLFASIAEWAKGFFADLWASLKRVIMTVATLLFVALVLILIAVIAFAVSAVLGWIVVAVLVILAAVLLISILTDVVKPTPTVSQSEVDPNTTKRPDGIGEALDETSEVDDAAATDPNDSSFMDHDPDAESVVKVSKVVDSDGTVRWRVALPSTQEWLTWLHGSDGGAVNDLDSNLALMLTPALQTQYERAVMEAMRQAGVGKDDPVMLVGFSQGGIMAGHLASYNSQYNWQAVVVSGAPIDGMPIPNHVSVVSVQHNGDPVPRLDTITNGVIGSPDRSNWLTIRVDSPDSSGVGEIHNAKNYSATLQNSQDEVRSNFPGLDNYFVTEKSNNVGESSDYYRWQE